MLVGARERHRPNLRHPGCPQRFSHVLATFRHVEADLRFGVAAAVKRPRFKRNVRRTPSVIRQDTCLVETALAQPFVREWHWRKKCLRGKVCRQRLEHHFALMKCHGNQPIEPEAISAADIA
ncbi:MAG: hypothetical protein QF376_04110 [Anaerolineales bacterium]|jgi:hypothetical protein|nr:hypothetical protein [Anaerolineales bacterium]HJO32866.1 hypothetical protein [Anaerolineales bacterium]|tara:strand:- start:888 stop:1253 length:366 start_codon:yes stop_codon:yes gene_type:complete